MTHDPPDTNAMPAQPRRTQIDPELLGAAKTAFENAYAPYSHFKVGAALRTPSGALFSGANVENASYGLGRCAEQSAVQAMASAGGSKSARIKPLEGLAFLISAISP